MPPVEEVEDEVEELEEQHEEETPEPAAQKAKPEPKDDSRDLREENKALRGRLSEAEQNAQFWHGKAKDGKAAPAAEAMEEASEALSEDIVDALASGDTRRISKLFKEMGFVRKGDVDQAIDRTRAQITEESALYGKYPELKDKDSEFFQLTAEKYNELALDPVLAKSPKLIEIAAKLATAEMGGDAPASRRRGGEEETERVRRVSAQAGDRGTKAARQTADNSELSKSQASLIAKFRAAGSTLTEDGYKKTASRGVRMSGLGSRGRS